MTFYQHFLALE